MPRDPSVPHIAEWFCGEGRIGKSYLAFQENPDAYSKNARNLWWSNYKSQATVIINEFRGKLLSGSKFYREFNPSCDKVAYRWEPCKTGSIHTRAKSALKEARSSWYLRRRLSRLTAHLGKCIPRLGAWTPSAIRRSWSASRSTVSRWGACTRNRGSAPAPGARRSFILQRQRPAQLVQAAMEDSVVTALCKILINANTPSAYPLVVKQKIFDILFIEWYT